MKAMLDLGLERHANVARALEIMRTWQGIDGGWVCREGPCVDESSCVIPGTPWVFACLAQIRMVNLEDSISRKTVELFSKIKRKIVRHGYQMDRCYRCDETEDLYSLEKLGLSKRQPCSEISECHYLINKNLMVHGFFEESVLGGTLLRQ